jgi:RNA polymerase sigma-70 factor (ECF subfamily)
MSTTEPRDEELVNLAQEGDREAFVILYRRYVREIYGYLLNQLGDVADAEDVTSETFLRLVTSLDSFRSESRFRTWVYAVARNQLRDHWRSRGRRPSTVELEAQMLPDVGAGEAPTPNPRATELGRRVLAKLPVNYRQVVEMRVMEGRSVRDTADELDLSEGNVKVLLHRGLKKAESIANEMAEQDDVR